MVTRRMAFWEKATELGAQINVIASTDAVADGAATAREMAG
jgi:hypothetical protein